MKIKNNTKSDLTEQARSLAHYTYEWINIHVPSLKTNSHNTERSYRISLSLYAEFLESVKGITPFNLTGDCFSVERLNEWLIWLKQIRGVCNGTCNNRMAAIKSLLEYMGGRDPAFSYLHIRASEHIHPLREPKRKVTGMSRQAVQAIFAVPDIKTPIGLRDLVLMMLSYGVAARIDEVLSLKIIDIHLKAKDPFVILHGKGGKIRSIYLQKLLVEWLERYLKLFHEPTPKPNDFLFYSPCHTIGAKLTQTAVSKRLRLYAKIAHERCEDVPLDLHSHLWRHSMALHWREDNINIVEIKELMGHSSLQSTMVYQDVTEEQKKAAIETLEDTVTKAMKKKWKLPENKGVAAMFGI
ncbi:tyrosine-type recombinase/integrase [Arachidicoccus soli]|uniref:Integrase n=1 Tax=Arachidicoccus soli TaxID=2341117 RepID=A0A386HP09_9BACT|nr:tyrosine-type recombinase/integrase [Arachidicoccus soli]AYD47379.1 integrase [Arachidicoccus soli]